MLLPKNTTECRLSRRSVDLWTSKHSQQGFAAMDIQYGNPFTATIDSFTLAVKYFPEEHTHEVLVDFIKNVSSYYGFVSVLAWILVASIDGGSNIVLACQVLLQRGSNTSVLCQYCTCVCTNTSVLILQYCSIIRSINTSILQYCSISAVLIRSINAV